MGSFHLKGVCTAAWVPAIDLALGKRALWKPIFLTEPGRGERPLVTTPHLEGRWQGCWQAHLGPLLSSANGRGPALPRYPGVGEPSLPSSMVRCLGQPRRPARVGKPFRVSAVGWEASGTSPLLGHN